MKIIRADPWSIIEKKTTDYTDETDRESSGGQPTTLCRNRIALRTGNIL